MRIEARPVYPLKNMKAKLKSIYFWFMLLTLTLGISELICHITFRHFKQRFTFYDLHKYFSDDKIYTKGILMRYHPERGWDSAYPTEFGERPRSAAYDKSLISAFGDSYTYCAEVKDHETWEERLSALLQENVYNFGVGGYGTDQATLKFLSVFPNVRTPIVILGLATENINRIVNVYRPFYYEKTLVKLTKPRFVLKGDRLFLSPNPVPSLRRIKDLRNADFLKQLGRNDFWFNRDRYPELRFPYLKILFNRRIWREIIYGKKISDMSPRPYENLWEDKEASALMFKILESFATRAREYGAVPIVMISPSQAEVLEKFERRKDSAAEKKILDFCRERDILVFNSIQALANRVDSAGDVESFFSGHVSFKGNQIIAEALYDFLKSHAFSCREIEIAHSGKKI
jgi:hypothetical protein